MSASQIQQCASYASSHAVAVTATLAGAYHRSSTNTLSAITTEQYTLIRSVSAAVLHEYFIVPDTV
jgi:hypothetical protein